MSIQLKGLSDYMVNTVLYYLNLMGKEYVYNEDDNTIEVDEEVNGKKFKIKILFGKTWVQSVYTGPSIEKLEPEKKFEIMKKLLELNAETMEMKFGVDKKERIVVSVESHALALTFDNFYMEYNALPHAIMYLEKEIIPIIKGQKIEKESSEKEETSALEIDVLKQLLVGSKK